jgi:hypothetical protein
MLIFYVQQWHVQFSKSLTADAKPLIMYMTIAILFGVLAGYTHYTRVVVDLGHDL